MEFIFFGSVYVSKEKSNISNIRVLFLELFSPDVEEISPREVDCRKCCQLSFPVYHTNVHHCVQHDGAGRRPSSPATADTCSVLAYPSSFRSLFRLFPNHLANVTIFISQSISLMWLRKKQLSLKLNLS